MLFGYLIQFSVASLLLNLHTNLLRDVTVTVLLRMGHGHGHVTSNNLIGSPCFLLRLHIYCVTVMHAKQHGHGHVTSNHLIGSRKGTRAAQHKYITPVGIGTLIATFFRPSSALLATGTAQ